MLLVRKLSKINILCILYSKRLELSHASTTVISHDYSEPTTNNKRLMEKLMRMSLMRVA